MSWCHGHRELGRHWGVIYIETTFFGEEENLGDLVNFYY